MKELIKKDREELAKDIFLSNLISHVNNYTLNYSDDVNLITPEIMSVEQSEKKIKTYKNLIKQFEEAGDREKMLDTLYTELIFITAAYQYAMFLQKYDENVN